MQLYRMSKERHSNGLSGKGAELVGGRWNKVGIPALYLAENISLSILETIVHCQRISDLYQRFVLSIEVPKKSIEEIDLKQLPKDWNKTPWHNFTIDYGSNWLSSRKSLLLKIPSAVIPNETVFLVNPLHKSFNHVKIVNRDIFLPDNRLKLSG